MLGEGGADQIDGGQGDDVLMQAPFQKEWCTDIRTETGSSTAILGFDADVVSGGDGNDLIGGNAGDNKLFGDAGSDTIAAGSGEDVISAGDGRDLIFGEAGDDHIKGEGGKDTVYGGEGDDLIEGGVDSDLVYGDSGDDVVHGGTGGDVLIGGTGLDHLMGKRVKTPCKVVKTMTSWLVDQEPTVCLEKQGTMFFRVKR